MLLALPAYRNIRPSPPNVGRQSCTSYFCRLMVSFFAHQLLAGRGITTAVGLRTFVLFYELPGTRVYRFFPFLVFRLFFSLVFSSIFLESLSWIPTVSHHHTGDKIVHPPRPDEFSRWFSRRRECKRGALHPWEGLSDIFFPKPPVSLWTSSPLALATTASEIRLTRGRV